MASSDSPDSKLDIEESPTSASFMPKKSGDELEGAEETNVLDHVEDPTYQKSKRPHTLTEKGLEYQRPLREKGFQRTFRKRKDKLHELDMEWIDISDPHVFRKKRSDIEEYWQDLDKVQSEYVPLLLEKESRDAIEAANYLTKQVVELRMRISERIIQLEKEGLRSRNSKRSSYSKMTGDTRTSKGSTSSQISLLKMKLELNWPKGKCMEMKYPKIETEKKMEMERKKHEIEELQRLKSYESAKAEANAVARLEEEERNSGLKDPQEFQLNEDAKEELVCDYISSLPDLNSVSSQIPLPDSHIPTSTGQHPTSSSQRVKRLEPSQIDQTPQEQINSPINAPINQDLVTPTPLYINNSGHPYSTPFEVPTVPYGPALMETQ